MLLYLFGNFLERVHEYIFESIEFFVLWKNEDIVYLSESIRVYVWM